MIGFLFVLFMLCVENYLYVIVILINVLINVGVV